MGAAAAVVGFTSLMQFQQTKTAGKISREESRVEEGQTKIAAKQEELGAIQREGDRKRRLAESLASQNAQAGASGIAAFEGSPLTVLSEDIRRESVATERDRFETKGRKLQQRISGISARSRGKMAKSSARSSANLGLLSGIGQAASFAPSGGSTLPVRGSGRGS